MWVAVTFCFEAIQIHLESFLPYPTEVKIIVIKFFFLCIDSRHNRFFPRYPQSEKNVLCIQDLRRSVAVFPCWFTVIPRDVAFVAGSVLAAT